VNVHGIRDLRRMRDWAAEPPTNWGEMKAHIQWHGSGCACSDELAVAVQRRLAVLRRTSGKTCTLCRTFLPLTAFGARSETFDGLFERCKACVSAVRGGLYD
jgi:hypothetical protein